MRKGPPCGPIGQDYGWREGWLSACGSSDLNGPPFGQSGNGFSLGACNKDADLMGHAFWRLTSRWKSAFPTLMGASYGSKRRQHGPMLVPNVFKLPLSGYLLRSDSKCSLGDTILQWFQDLPSILVLGTQFSPQSKEVSYGDLKVSAVLNRRVQ